MLSSLQDSGNTLKSTVGCKLNFGSTCLTDSGEHQIQVRRPPSASAVKKILDISEFSNLTKLMRVIVWVWRAATRWKKVLARTATTSKPKREKILSALEIKAEVKEATLTVRSAKNTLRHPFLEAQKEECQTESCSTSS